MVLRLSNQKPLSGPNAQRQHKHPQRCKDVVIYYTRFKYHSVAVVTKKLSFAYDECRRRERKGAREVNGLPRVEAKHKNEAEYEGCMILRIPNECV